jgi:hypothetical protein
VPFVKFMFLMCSFYLVSTVCHIYTFWQSTHVSLYEYIPLWSRAFLVHMFLIVLPIVLVVLNDFVIFVSLSSISYIANIVSRVCEWRPFLLLLRVVFVFFLMYYQIV